MYDYQSNAEIEYEEKRARERAYEAEIDREERREAEDREDDASIARYQAWTGSDYAFEMREIALAEAEWGACQWASHSRLRTMDCAAIYVG